jgi:hypothetical protein
MKTIFNLSIIFILSLFGILSCTFPDEVPFSDFIQAEPWPQADALFHSDPKWLGSDDAYSIDLGNGKVLWLFGDTFIATSDKNIRNESIMIRNSIGIQNGYDPSRSSIKFYWRNQNERYGTGPGTG